MVIAVVFICHMRVDAILRPRDSAITAYCGYTLTLRSHLSSSLSFAVRILAQGLGFRYNRSGRRGKGTVLSASHITVLTRLESTDLRGLEGSSGSDV